MERGSIDECNNCHKRNRNDDERPNEQLPPLFVRRQKVIPWWLAFHPSKASPDCDVSAMCTCGKGRRLTRPETHLKLLITPCIHIGLPGYPRTGDGKSTAPGGRLYPQADLPPGTLRAAHCNLYLKARWNVAKWRAPDFAGLAGL